MKITYNSPVVLTFALLATIVMILENSIGGVTIKYFALPPDFSFSDPLDYLRIFTYVLGHGDWPHLVGNFSFILLIGPIVEEKYGAKDLLFMMGITTIITAILHIIFFDNYALGASGIVFMMIMLGSLVNLKKGTIPLTFVFILALYLGQEIYRAFAENNNISEFAHIVGGLFGTLFGFLNKKT